MAPSFSNSKSDRQLLYGYTWSPVSKVRPCLLCAMQVREPPNIRIRHVRHARWALDYPYTAGLEVRARTVATRWLTRPAHVAHLYPPWISYWERRSGRRYPNNHEEAYVLFQDTDRLKFLIDPRAGYARLTDPDGLLEPLLLETARIGTLWGERGFWKGQAILCRILDLLLSARRVDKTTWRIGGQNDSDGLTDLSRAVEAYLRANLGKRLTLADIARQVHVSASTLTHRYHAETGRTPMHTLRDLRLSVAKGLLTKGWKLKEIAEQTGFTDAFHFSRTFKETIGSSPREFVRKLQIKGR